MFVTCSLQRTTNTKPKGILLCWFVCLKVVHILNISFIRDGMLSKSFKRENFDNILANELDFSIFLFIAFGFYGLHWEFLVCRKKSACHKYGV